MGKARYRKDSGRWRGPAVIVMQESHQKYFVSWRGRCLLLAGPNLRRATSEETAPNIVKEEMDELKLREEEPDGRKEYEELTQLKSPPDAQMEVRQFLDAQRKKDEVAGEARRMMSGMRSMKKLFGDREKKVAKQMLGIEDRRRQKRPRLKAIKDGSVGGRQPELPELPIEDGEYTPSEPPEDPGKEPDSDDEFWKEVEKGEDDYVRADDERMPDQHRHAREQMKQQLQNQTPSQRRHALLDDFPAAALKRTAEEDTPQLAKRLKSSFYTTLMVSSSQKELQEKKGRQQEPQHASEWLSKRELQALKEVCDSSPLAHCSS